MSKILKDRNEAFSLYFGLGTDRSLSKLRDKIRQENPESTPNIEALKEWSKKYSWQAQVMLMDKAVAEGLADTLVPSWIELKAELVSVLINQIRAGIKAGIITENCRDLTTCSRELRALIVGDITKINMKAEIEPPQQIEFVMYDSDGVRRDAKTKEPTEYQSEQGDDPVTQIRLPDNHRERETL